MTNCKLLKRKQAIVERNGRMREVTNLGWLLRNWAQVESLHWRSIEPREGYPMSREGLFTAKLHGGGEYRIEYASFDVWKNFIDRPVFRGLPVTVNGITGKV